MFEVPTANLFKLDGDHPTLLTRESVDKEQEGEEFEWPPYKKVGTYDPLGDDPRLSVTNIEFCLSSRSLCVGGVGGQVILFALASTSNEVTVEVRGAGHSDHICGDISLSHPHRQSKQWSSPKGIPAIPGWERKQ